jgi:hypothetical protein
MFPDVRPGGNFPYVCHTIYGKLFAMKGRASK